MPTPKLTPDQIAEVSSLVAGYISAQRERYAVRAHPLSAQQRAAVAAFFSPELLGNTRLVSHEPFSDGMLFHELVHVEQYRQLSIPRFAELYGRGFLNGGSYDAIPLEVNAYTLEGRFRSDPRRVFSVQQEVARWAAEGHL